MKTMGIQKKSQVSFEYIVLFSFALLIFLILGTLIVSGMENAKNIESEAEYFAKRIKSATIIASLSDSDYSTKVYIPESLSGTKILVDIYPDPDNMVIIRKEGYVMGDYEVLAREFLPIIYHSDVKDQFNGLIIISKTDEKITITGG